MNTHLQALAQIGINTNLARLRHIEIYVAFKVADGRVVTQAEDQELTRLRTLTGKRYDVFTGVFTDAEG